MITKEQLEQLRAEQIDTIKRGTEKIQQMERELTAINGAIQVLDYLIKQYESSENQSRNTADACVCK